FVERVQQLRPAGRVLDERVAEDDKPVEPAPLAAVEPLPCFRVAHQAVRVQGEQGELVGLLKHRTTVPREYPVKGFCCQELHRRASPRPILESPQRVYPRPGLDATTYRRPPGIDRARSSCSMRAPASKEGSRMLSLVGAPRNGVVDPRKSGRGGV